LWNHDSSRAPIARAYDVAVIDGHLEIGMEFDVEDDFAMQVAGKIRRGFINAGSVGFISHQMGWREDLDKSDPNYAEGYGMVLDDNELMEFSITPVQSNRGALVAQRRAAFEQRSRPDRQADDIPAFLREATTPTQPGDPAC
jgi:HK97 family phage prohead protease